MEVIRHGGAAHVVRPDRVYRTGVISSMQGYLPGRDAQAVLASFTSRGLSGLGEPGPLARFWIRVKGAFAARRAQKFVGVASPSVPSPEPQQAHQIAPQMQAQMAMLPHLAPNAGNMPRRLEAAANALASRRYFSFYRAG